jgi:hypothetical protein
VFFFNLRDPFGTMKIKKEEKKIAETDELILTKVKSKFIHQFPSVILFLSTFFPTYQMHLQFLF